VDLDLSVFGANDRLAVAVAEQERLVDPHSGTQLSG
jgi:hypothetical protein